MNWLHAESIQNWLGRTIGGELDPLLNKAKCLVRAFLPVGDTLIVGSSAAEDEQAFVDDLPLLRIPVDPTPANGLAQPNQIMIDKVSTTWRSSVQKRLGTLAPADLVRVERSLLVLLGMGA